MTSLTNRTVGTSTGTGSFAARLMADVAGRFAAWNDARVTRNSLNALTDHELRDLGIIRSDIEAIARGTFRRD